MIVSARHDVIVRQVFRLLVRAYPPAFRAALGGDMEDTLLDRYRAAWLRGTWISVVSFWWRALWDVAVTAISERAERRRLRARERRTVRLSQSTEGFRSMGNVGQELRYSLRRLRKSPGFTAIAVTIMGLGIGANTAIFSIVDAVLFRPLPYENPEEIVRIFTSDSDGITPAAVSYPDFVDYRDRTDLFSGAVAFENVFLSLTGDGQSEVVMGEFLCADYFSVLGLTPALGRSFTPDEDEPGASGPVAMMAFDTWQRRYGADPTIVGSTIRLNGRAVTVVGIGPEGYAGSTVGITSEYWLPWGSAVQVEPRETETLEGRINRSLMMSARLRPGVTLDQAEAALNVLAKRLEDQYPQTNENRTVSVFPSNQVRLHPIIDSALYPIAGLLMAVVGLVLLVACSNIANLLLVRAASRGKEVAIMLAIGARRSRLVAQLLTESTLLGVAGGVAGLLIAIWIARLIVSFKPPLPISVALDLTLDWRVLGFTAVLSVITGVLFGLAPALRASRPALVNALKDETHSLAARYRRFGIRNLLVVSQVAVSLVLLVGAGLFVRSLINSQRADPGFETAHTAMATFNTDVAYDSDAEAEEFLDRLVERLASHPGVRSVALSDRLPLTIGAQINNVYIEGMTPPPGADGFTADFASASPGYFSTMEIPILRGRAFTDADNRDARPVAVVSATMARRFWGTEDVLGRRFARGRRANPLVTEIVGVAQDVKVRSLGEAPRSYFYIPTGQDSPFMMSVVVRASGDPAAVPNVIMRMARELDANVPVMEARTMGEHVGVVLFIPRMGAALLLGFGVLAMLLASLGLYGVMAFSVTQRTRELGVRLALGAGQGRVVSMVVRQGLALAGVGAAVGLALSMLAMQAVATMLNDVSPTDPVTLVSMTLLLVLVAGLASYIPAHRAARSDPLVALRAE
jgi:macrolide transport system ATP-binding/permease protein